MRRALAGLLLAAALAGCSADGDGAPLPGPDVDVDTVELRETKERIGMADCAPGPSGEPAEQGLPALTLPCLGGGEAVDLSTLRGPLVLNLWASWCEGCRTEMPALEAFRERHGDRVPVLGMNVNDLFPDKALALAEDTGATYPSVADPGGEIYGTEAFAFARRGLPAFVFVAEDGSVAGRSSGAVDSVDDIEELVAEHLGMRL